MKCKKILMFKLGKRLFNFHQSLVIFHDNSSASASASAFSLSIDHLSVDDILSIPTERIRNFCTIAHVDHGKSTLSDRIIEIGCNAAQETSNPNPDENGKGGNIVGRKGKSTMLDRLEVEKMRGITVKAQSTSILYESKVDGQKYLFNLVDSPGHADFSFEVRRSLAASQGALLLVDANSGVQAQTLNHYLTAFAADKVILPVLNKIDLLSRTGLGLEEAEKEMQSQLDLEPGMTQISKISAKTGFGVGDLLERIVSEIPAPVPHNPDKPCRMHVIDSWYDDFRGTIMLVYCDNGTFKKGDWIESYRQEAARSFEILEMGILYGPVVSFPLPQIRTGQVAYLYLNVKDDGINFLGDTFFKRERDLHDGTKGGKDWRKRVEPLPLLPASKPSVFAGFYPAEASELDNLQKALKRLCLTDASVTIEQESSDSLGVGWRLGFLGSLHMDVFRQRLIQQISSSTSSGDDDDSIVITPPTVPYLLPDGSYIHRPSDLTSDSIVQGIKEPMVRATIISTMEHYGTLNRLFTSHRGQQQDITTSNDGQRVTFDVVFPLAEVITGFQDRLMQITSGFASFHYEDYGYEEVDLRKVAILFNGKMADSFVFLVPLVKCDNFCRRLVTSLRNFIPRQQIEVSIQAAIFPGKRIVSRETLSPYRKDVTAKCYGGDHTRKQKLLDRQKEGKKRLKAIGSVSVPNDTYLKLMKDMSMANMH